MDLKVAAAYFDAQPVLDAYTSDLLFTGQMDLYDGTKRDAEYGFRRSVSTTQVAPSSRGVVTVLGSQFVTGRVVQDFFQDVVIREHLLLHPCDGQFSAASPAEFLKTTPDPVSFYASSSWFKEVKDEPESPRYFNQVKIYTSDSEVIPRGWLINSGSGAFYKVQNPEKTAGGLISLTCDELGEDAFCTVIYTPLGTYDVETDSSGALTPISLKGFLTRFQTGYRYPVSATPDFETGDRILTVSQADMPTPVPGDLVTAGGDFRVLAALDDEYGGWDLHLRLA